MTYERLVLTPLEIATISLGAGLGPGEDPADLGLPKLAGFEDPMALHGLQSLSVRGLMSVDSDGSVVMEPRLALLGALLADLQRCWMIALSEVEATAGGRIVGSELGHAYLQ
jgi:hypothetical protein